MSRFQRLDSLQNVPTYIFSGGGTGGHLFPGIAVAQELQRRDPSVRIFFVGSDRRVEQRIIKSYGFEHRPLYVKSPTTLRQHPWQFFWKNGVAWRQAQQIVRSNQPWVVIGLGGFASIPVVLAARRNGVPSILLEQNAVPGKATRWLIRCSSQCCISFPRTGDQLPASRGISLNYTGNPVRASIVDLHQRDRQADQDGPNILLVLGGSQGASALNEAMLGFIQGMITLPKNWRVVHQTGSHDFENISQKYRDLQIDAQVAEFFDDLPMVYRQASLALTRGGATTLAELACVGIPAVIVPYPHATNNHQFFNARIYAEQGGALIAEQANHSSQTQRNIHEHLVPLLSDSVRLNTMRSAMRCLAKPAAAQDVADQIMLLNQRRVEANRESIVLRSC